MSAPRLLVVAGALAISLSACNSHDSPYQGWVEANLIFVAPDEIGRVQTLSVREGDVVKAGDELFTVDDDLSNQTLASLGSSCTRV